MKKIKELEEKVLQAKEAYYNLNEPIMSDEEFDSLVDELKAIDPTNKVANMVGAPVRTSPWQKKRHIISMGSQLKVNTPEELEKWYKDFKGQAVVTSEKIDGISISVLYTNGVFDCAITRGSDGVEGEDISTNVVRMQGFKKELSDNFTGALRGEILMKNSIHKEFFPNLSNPRNGASGIAKKLSGENSDKLNIFFYQVVGSVQFKSKFSEFGWLHSNHLDTPKVVYFANINDAISMWKKYQESERDLLDYWIDGLIVEINDLAVAAEAGENNQCPNASRAFKFTNQLTPTKIVSFVWQVGNSGRVTPVCNVEERLIQGSKVSNASVYNQAEIDRLGLDIGAEVLITKANEIIPKIISVTKSTGTVHKAPTHCPACNTELVMAGKNIQCPNTSTCPGQTTGRIKNWISELNILEVGDTLIEKLVESGKVTTIADLYKLSVDDYAGIDRMGQKSAKTVHNNLWKDSEVTLDKFLGGLSMTMIGSSTIKLIMDAGCDTLEKFGQLTANEFENVAGVGPIKAKYLEQGLKNNQSLILDLLASGVKIKGKVHGNLTGKKIAITGSTKMKRAELEKLIESHGGENKSSAGKGTSYLVIADVASQSSKAVAARKLGIELITEDDFLKLIT